MAEFQKKVSQSTGLIYREKISDENHLPKIHKRTISESAADKRRLHKQNQKQKLYRQISWNDCNTRNRVIFAEGWEKLTDEERAKLEIDIFKPLDFYEILFNRIKANIVARLLLLLMNWTLCNICSSNLCLTNGSLPPCFFCLYYCHVPFGCSIIIIKIIVVR